MASSFKDENYDSEPDSCFEVDMVSSASEKSESVDWHPALSSQPVVTTQVSEYQQGNVSYLALPLELSESGEDEDLCEAVNSSPEDQVV